MPLIWRYQKLIEASDVPDGAYITYSSVNSDFTKIIATVQRFVGATPPDGNRYYYSSDSGSTFSQYPNPPYLWSENTKIQKTLFVSPPKVFSFNDISDKLDNSTWGGAWAETNATTVTGGGYQMMDANDGSVYLATYGPGTILKTDDYGTTWNQIFNIPFGDTHSVVCGYGQYSDVMYFSASSGIYCSVYSGGVRTTTQISVSTTGYMPYNYVMDTDSDGSVAIFLISGSIYIYDRGLSSFALMPLLPTSFTDIAISYNGQSIVATDHSNNVYYLSDITTTNWETISLPGLSDISYARLNRDGSQIIVDGNNNNGLYLLYESLDSSSSESSSSEGISSSSSSSSEGISSSSSSSSEGISSSSSSSSEGISSSSSSSSEGISSSSSSSEGISSSSSSSSIFFTEELYAPLLSQNHSNLIPFNFIAESGFVDDSVLSFSIDMLNPMHINSDSIISSILVNRDSSAQIVGSTYIPESEDAQYRHEPIMYVDVIAKDQSGISKVSARPYKEIYEYNDPQYTYNTPKFSWSNEIQGDEELSESSDENNMLLWFGTADKTLHTVICNKDYAVNVSSTDVTSEVYGLLFNSYNSNLHVSGYDHLAINTVNNYYKDITESHQLIEIANPNEDIFSYASNVNTIISTQSYLGKVIVRDQTTLDIVSEYEGFDAPFKVIRSAYHNCYLVAGTNTIWKLFDDGTKLPVYGIDGYKISDIDCSENGSVCILFNNEVGGILRTISNNLYSIITETRVNDFFFRFCKYCGKGLFYAIAELSVQNSNTYIAKNYVVDINKKSILGTDISSNVVTTTTTTTFVKPTSKVEIKSPVGGESWQNGTNHDIKWTSTESVNTQVSIELYKGSKLSDIITSGNNNSGTYNWLVSNAYSEASDYKIKINWLAPGDTSNFSTSGNFSIVANAVTETTTTSAIIQDKCIGITFSEYNNSIVISLRNGLIGVYDMTAFDFHGLFDCGIRNVICLAVDGNRIRKPKGNTKVRLFVGSQPYLSNKWDSGVIETELTSVYYGGGNNLTSGEVYYVNLQVYSDRYGWSEIQTRQFTMPN